MTTPTPAARLVPEHERMAFLPTYFGPRDFLKGELLVYRWNEPLAED